jgi:AAA family ATP:ADP antiporter
MSPDLFGDFIQLVHAWRWPLLIVLGLAYGLQWRRVPSSMRQFTLTMSLYFFLVIFAYWLLKPMKKGVFVAHYKLNGGLFGLAPSQMELLAKEANVFIALIAAFSLIWLRRRFADTGYPVAAVLLFALGFLALVPLATEPGAAFAWALYVYGDAFVSGMVALFFASLHDRSSVADARSVYGLAGLGGVLGGFAGSASAGSLDQALGVSGTLATCALLTLAVAGLAWLAARQAVVRHPARDHAERGFREHGNLLRGARAALHSPTLRLIAGLLLVYEIVSVIMDYQFTAVVSSQLPASELKAYFGAVYTFTNLMALVVQLFLATWMLKRFGPHTALLVMPFVIILGEAAYLAFPVLLAASLLNTADGAFAYSIQQTARESLYVPLSRREKHEAKAFIDIVWLRAAKGLAVVISMAISLLLPSGNGPWLALVVMLLTAVWLMLLRETGQPARIPPLASAKSSPI